MLAGKVFVSEFIVLSHCSYNVILQMDFLQHCGASVGCGSGEMYVSKFLLSEHSDQSSYGEEIGLLSVLI